MATKPFHFRLKKVSRREQELLRAVHEYLPATGLREGFAKGVGEAIARHVGEEFSFQLSAVHQETYSSFLSKIPQPAVMAVVGLAPLSRGAIVEIDSPLAQLAVERLLGGRTETYPEPRVLSDTEQGVLEYLILQIMAHIHRLCGKDARVHFRFDRFAFGPHEMRDLAGAEDGVAVLTFRVALGSHSGFVRLALPDPFVEEGMLCVEAPGEIRKGERDWRAGQLARFGYIRSPLWAEAGRTTLAASDLAELEDGDVIIFDQSSMVFEDGRPSGSVVLRVGDGLHGGIDAQVAVDDKRVLCSISGIHKGD
ncbi:MAG: hypothetical protein V2A66_09875 [Pseudomonadota bacterium]